MDATTGTRMATTEEVLEGLNDLLQLDHDAVAAYEVAMSKLEDRDHADQIAGFRRDHERHIRELNEAIAELGGTPRNAPHATGPFKAALQGLAAVGGDKGLLIAFRTNELQVRNKYDSYASKALLWPAETKRLVDRAALDEERHYRWVADALAALGVGMGEGAEIDAATRAREGGSGGRLADVREKVSDGVGAVTNRISGLLDTHEGPLSGPIDRVRGGAQGAVGGARDARDDFETRVREKPLQTLLVAAVAGFVVGRMLR